MKTTSAKLINKVILFYLGTHLFEAPLRYFFYLVHLEAAIYIRELIPLAVILTVFLRSLFMPHRVDSVVYVVFAVMAYGLCVAGFFIDGSAQILFGLRLYIPFCFGLCAYQLSKETQGNRYVMLAFLLFSAGGVLLNLLVSFPWVGLSYSVGGVEVDVARQWWTRSGLPRYSGFAHASFDAATQILICLLYVHVTFENRILKLLLWGISGAAIALTTSKTPIFCFFITGLLLAAQAYVPRFAKAVRWLPLLLSILMLASPWILDQVVTFSNARISRVVLYSLFDRAQSTWPEAFKLLQHYGSLVFGRGVGGIGTAQDFFELSLFNPADNLMIYAYGSFGVIGVCLIVFTSWKSAFLNWVEKRSDRVAFLLILSTVIVGQTCNLIEEPWAAYFFGFSVAYLFGTEKTPISVPWPRTHFKTCSLARRR